MKKTINISIREINNGFIVNSSIFVNSSPDLFTPPAYEEYYFSRREEVQDFVDDILLTEVD